MESKTANGVWGREIRVTRIPLKQNHRFINNAYRFSIIKAQLRQREIRKPGSKTPLLPLSLGSRLLGCECDVKVQLLRHEWEGLKGSSVLWESTSRILRSLVQHLLHHGVSSY